jgi:hypothetical protein
MGETQRTWCTGTLLFLDRRFPSPIGAKKRSLRRGLATERRLGRKARLR